MLHEFCYKVALWCIANPVESLKFSGGGSLHHLSYNRIFCISQTRLRLPVVGLGLGIIFLGGKSYLGKFEFSVELWNRNDFLVKNYLSAIIYFLRGDLKNSQISNSDCDVKSGFQVSRAHQYFWVIHYLIGNFWVYISQSLGTTDSPWIRFTRVPLHFASNEDNLKLKRALGFLSYAGARWSSRFEALENKFKSQELEKILRLISRKSTYSITLKLWKSQAQSTKIPMKSPEPKKINRYSRKTRPAITALTI